MTRRVVRLFVLLSLAFAAYLALCLLDHGARADTGSIGDLGATDPVAAVKTIATKAATEPKSIIPEAAAPKVHTERTHRPTIKPPKVQAPKVQTPKVQAPKAPALKKAKASSARVGETVRRVQVRTSKVGQATSDAVHSTVAPVRAAAIRLPSVPELVKLPGLPRVELPAQLQLPSLPPLPSWTQLPSWPQLVVGPQLSAVPQLPGLSQVTTPVSPSASTPRPSLTPALSAQAGPLQQPSFRAPATGLSGVVKPPATRTAPPPAPPRQPADPSTTPGQARDAGGGSAPAMGTVASPWRPEVTATGRLLATDLIVRGRTVRYAGPPS
ncbi:hypothetical protein [Paractinoplanes durhamensis]|uniref:hypothetical protein n=1 Tax=Paractinoplanes durhamensis TaxID=113563 RepID=UPI0031DBE7ED